MPQSSSAAELVSTEHHAKRIRTGIDPDLEWFLHCGGSAVGERGTMGGIVSALEHGGHSGGVPNTDLYSDEQIGWARHVYGTVEKHRWLTAAWLALTLETQNVLLARYRAPDAQFRSDEGFGARDRYVEGSDGKTGRHGATRTGSESLLGEYASLAFKLCADAGKLLLACREPDPVKTNKEGLVVVDREKQAQRRKARSEALKVAQAASDKAHVEWAESKAGADPMRKRSQRVSVGGAHVPVEE